LTLSSLHLTLKLYICFDIYYHILQLPPCLINISVSSFIYVSPYPSIIVTPRHNYFSYYGTLYATNIVTREEHKPLNRIVCMRWMEMITLRAALRQGKDDEVTTLLYDSIKEMGRKKGLVEARVLSCASVHSDLALNLIWETSHPERNGSSLGLSMAQTLKAFGLVEHTIWAEEATMQTLERTAVSFVASPAQRTRENL
jgi:hypothetical protein